MLCDAPAVRYALVDVVLFSCDISIEEIGGRDWELE